MGPPVNTFGSHSSVPNACLGAVRISKAYMASKASTHAMVQHTMQGRSRSGTTMRTRLLEAHVAKLVATRMRHWLHAKLAAKTPLAGRLGRLPMATLSQCPLCSLHALPNVNGPCIAVCFRAPATWWDGAHTLCFFHTWATQEYLIPLYIHAESDPRKAGGQKAGGKKAQEV